MRHRKKRLQLNRWTSWHDATLRSLARNLLIHQSIKTSLYRAKAVQPLAEKLISMAKRNTLAAKRSAFKVIGDHRLVRNLFGEIGPRFADRAGGYTRIINLGRRRGDSAKMAVLELTVIKRKEAKKRKKVKEEVETGEEKHLSKEAIKEKPPLEKKLSKKFLGGIRKIFKKERDSL